MNNLFLMHSQINIILANAIVREEFFKGKNDLMIFPAFNITDSMRKKILPKYDNVIITKNIYKQSRNSYLSRFYLMYKTYRYIRKTLVKYDQVFLTQDTKILDMFIMKCCYHKNKQVCYIYVEEGVLPYYSPYVENKGLASNNLLLMARKFILKYLLGLGRFYTDNKSNDRHYTIAGIHPLITENYVTFPDYVRRELHHQKSHQISKESIKVSINEIYDRTHINFSEGTVIIAFDKLDTYRDLSKIEIIVKQICDKTKKAGKEVYYKYHPRETKELTSLKDMKQIEKNVALEAVLARNIDKFVNVIGMTTTVLQMAAFLGIKTISLIRMCEIDYQTEIEKFFSNIGIEMPTNMSEIII